MLQVAVVLVVVAFSTLLIILRFSLTTNKANLNINGKYVLITGCDSGFGRETAIRLDKMEVHVLATCLTKEGEQSLKSVTSDRLRTFQMDVTDSQQIEEAFCKVNKLLGGKSGKTENLFFLVVNLLSVVATQLNWTTHQNVCSACRHSFHTLHMSIHHKKLACEQATPSERGKENLAKIR